MMKSWDRDLPNRAGCIMLVSLRYDSGLLLICLRQSKPPLPSGVDGGLVMWAIMVILMILTLYRW